MKTIIQKLPTIYGEALNGSVYGQPNGSIARPPQSIPAYITISGDSAKLTKVSDSGVITLYQISGITGDYLFPSGYESIRVNVADSTDTIIASVRLVGYSEPKFNAAITGLTSNEPTDGDTLTVTYIALDQDDNALATSNALSLTAVIP